MWGAIAAAAIVLAGFAVMSVLAANLSYDHRLRGLTTYLSATWGDALILPMAGFFLVFAIANGYSRKRDWIMGAVGATGGFVSGLLVQRSWLSDPAPRLNWTLIAPGVFNAAGWYHAVFLTLMSGFSAGSVFFLASVAMGRRLSALSAISTSVGVAALLAFFVLVAIDNSGTASASSVGTMLALSFSLMGLITLIGVATVTRWKRKN